jgi:hypothetical protein
VLLKHEAHTEQTRNQYTFLAEKPGKMILPRRPRCRGKDNVTIDVSEMQWEAANRIRLAADMN